MSDWQRWWRLHGERELRCILMTAWDPIGVGNAPEAWDEYDDYASGVMSRLHPAGERRHDAAAVAGYLQEVEVHELDGELSAKRARILKDLAEVLVAWFEWSFTRGGRPPREWIDGD